MAYDADTGAALWDTPQEAGGQIAEDPRHDAVIVTNPYYGATTMERFDLSTGEPIDTYDTRLGSGCFVEASPDGRVLAGFSCERSALALWSLDGAGASWRHVTDYTRRVNFGTWTTDERYAILSAREDSLPPDELDVTTGEITPIELPPGSTNLTIFPDGSGGAVSATGEGVGDLGAGRASLRTSSSTNPRPPFPAPTTGYAASRDVRAFKYADGSISVCDDPDESCVPVSYDGVSVGLIDQRGPGAPLRRRDGRGPGVRRA